MARTIQLLPSHVSEKIAAGEVIERPASVVKELVENSLDAGATEVEVRLEDGGKSLIEILDNGSGMQPEDLRRAVLRHATSKLRSMEDLDHLRTLGFRGEALPSVGAVSELKILTRSDEAQSSDPAHELTYPEQLTQITHGHFLGSSHGTRVQVRGLFSQVPARLKFLKSSGSEVAHVREWIERLALSHPEVGFKLISETRTLLSLRPADEAGRVRAVLGDGEDYPLVTLSNGLARAHWLQGLSSPQMRKIAQVINGRAVRDRMVQQAILAPFRQALLPGQFPAVAVFLEVDPAKIDVNVHPTKTEVRFLEGGQIFKAVESLLSAMIQRHGAPAFVASPQVSTSPSLGFPSPWQARESHFQLVPSGSPQSSIDTSTASSTPISTHPLASGRYSGGLFNTYLLYDLGQEVGLVDQHAAHERVRYEKLKKRLLSSPQASQSQHLLIPEAVKFNLDQKQEVQARLEWFSKLGFEAELFGENTLLIRAIPSEWGNENLAIRLRNLLERLISVESKVDRPDHPLLMDETVFEAMASEACHSAIRAGDSLDRIEAESLMTELFQCQHPWNCPHGRPTVVRIPRARFEEWFQRRV